MKFRMVFFITILAYVFNASATSPALVRCDEVLQTPHTIADIEDLAKLKLSIEKAKAVGDTSITFTALKDDYKHKIEELVTNLVKAGVMTREQFESQLKQEILRLQANSPPEIERKEELPIFTTVRNTKVYKPDGYHMAFRTVERGSFLMGAEKVSVTISKDFDMMATLTTQFLWKQIVERAHALFPGKYDGLKPDPSQEKNDINPVETVNFLDVEQWFEALNDLSAIGDLYLDEIVDGHKKGDVYRLPSEAEWEFVVRGRGQYNGTYFFGDDESKLEDYAWIMKTSQKKHHPVAQKRPLMIGDKDFYDMIGNLWSWVQDATNTNEKLLGGTDPVVNDGKDFRIVRGGACYLKNETMQTNHRSDQNKISAGRGISFRIVRDRK